MGRKPISVSPRVCSPRIFEPPSPPPKAGARWNKNAKAKFKLRHIELKHGTLRLRTLAFELPPSAKPTLVRVTVDDKELESEHKLDPARLTITLAQDLVLEAGHALTVRIA